MREVLFFDTSAIYAYVNRRDPAHEAIKKRLKFFKGKLIITNYIFDETATLVRVRLGHAIAVRVGRILLHSPQIDRIRITEADEQAAWALFSERQDKDYSFTDCTSFIVMRRLKIRKCLALDGHFRQEGFEE